MRTSEVPVRFLKDREGRFSHHKRSGWFSPFHAAWINLRAMFVYGADFFLVRPGAVVMTIGLLLMLPATFGPVDVGPVTLSVYWQQFGAALAIVGLQGLLLGTLARMFFDYTGARTERVRTFFTYTRSVAVAAVVAGAGAVLALPLVARYVGEGLDLATAPGWRAHAAVTGLFLVVAGFLLFVFTPLFHAAQLALEERNG